MAKRKCTSTDLQNTARYIHIKLRIEQHERTPINTGGELKCSGKIGSSWFTSGIHRVTIYTNPVIRLMILTLLQKKICSPSGGLIPVLVWDWLLAGISPEKRRNYCVPFLADLFIYSDEAACTDASTPKGEVIIVTPFLLTYYLRKKLNNYSREKWILYCINDTGMLTNIKKESKANVIQKWSYLSNLLINKISIT